MEVSSGNKCGRGRGNWNQFRQRSAAPDWEQVTLGMGRRWKAVLGNHMGAGEGE
jgi:hypothetical protein